MTKNIQFTIPLKPLSVNQAWQGRRFKTNTYKKWAQDVSNFIPRNKCVTGRVEVTVEVFIKNEKMSDVDNVLKTLFDTLSGSVFEDDRMIYALHVYKEHSDTPSIRVTIVPYD